MSNHNVLKDDPIPTSDNDAKSNCKPIEHPTQPSTSESSFDEQMQSVLDLLYQRVDGAVSNERIESVVNQILQSQQQRPIGSSAATENKPAALNAQTIIVQDMENYDDEEDVPMKNPAKPSVKTKTDRKTRNVTSHLPNSNGKDDRADDDAEVDWSIYDGIPLGRQGAQMMTAFGDGKIPLPAAVQAALLGARRKLQTTLQDARHIRRKQKALYRSAKNAIRAERPEKPGDYKHEWSSELLFRAAIGYDPLAFDPKCGFGLEDLYKLHPEEMNAYNRWNEMHGSATEAAEDGEDVGPTEDTPSAAATTPDMIVGHLQERAAQFDVRTYKMPSSWYMQYSNLRQKGTFLPRARRGAGTAALDAEWESTTRQKRPVGCKGGSPGWTHMSASAVRFLHWLGFDPASALPPPNDDVTAALAFLAYDFFGRIVEKAIFLRKVQQQSEAGIEVNETAITYELSEGEQLTEEDIARAMEDPDIQPAPLYSTGDTALGPQLYFGPGFEDRLEMEMEEMLWHSKEQAQLSEEELRIRQQEEALFSEISKPPAQDGIAALLARPQDEADESLAVPAEQKPRARATKRTKR